MDRGRGGPRAPARASRPGRRLGHRLGADAAVARVDCRPLARRRRGAQAARRGARSRGTAPRGVAARPPAPPREADERARRRGRAGRGRRRGGAPGPARAQDAQRPPLGAARDLRTRPDLRGGGTELHVGAELAELAAGWIARLRGAGAFRIALTGGSTVGTVYERLAGHDLGWPFWHVWWSDERDVPPEDERSNERLARVSLLARVAIPEAQVHPLR